MEITLHHLRKRRRVPESRSRICGVCSEATALSLEGSDTVRVPEYQPFIELRPSSNAHSIIPSHDHRKQAVAHNLTDRLYQAQKG